MFARIRSIWLAGSGAVVLTIVLSGVVAAATVITALTVATPVVAPTVVDTTATFEDADGNGVDDDCQTDVVADPVAAAAEQAAVDADADGTISVTEAAHSDRVGGTNCNHGGYVSTVAAAQCDATAPAGTSDGTATDEATTDVNADEATQGDEDASDASDAADCAADGTADETTDTTDAPATKPRRPRTSPRMRTAPRSRPLPSPTRSAGRTATTAGRSARLRTWPTRLHATLVLPPRPLVTRSGPQRRRPGRPPTRRSTTANPPDHPSHPLGADGTAPRERRRSDSASRAVDPYSAAASASASRRIPRRFADARSTSHGEPMNDSPGTVVRPPVWIGSPSPSRTGSSIQS